MTEDEIQENYRKAVALEARARVMWGDGPIAVRNFLYEKKISVEDSSFLVKELFEERRQVVLFFGKQLIGWGVAAMILGIIGWAIILSGMDFPDGAIWQHRTGPGRGGNPLWILPAVLAFLPLYGVYKFFSGIIWVKFPHKNKKDLSQWKPFPW